jgi:hypothetical protein
MLKNFVIGAFIILFGILLFLAFNIKNAYEVLPIGSSDTMEVAPFADWRKFEASSERFFVMLPSPPQYAKEAVPIPNTQELRRYEMYVSQKLDGPIFMISLITYPQDIDGPEKTQTLHDIVDEMMKTKPDNKLKELKDSLYQDYPAIDFSIANDNYDVRGRAFIVKRTVYLLTYIANNTEFTLGDYEHFIDSFKLLPKGEISLLISHQ